SRIIARQQRELREKVAQLTLLLEEKQRLQARIHRAAGGTTALNEQFLRRISADLHDGPAQDVGLALLRLDSLTERCEACPLPSSEATHPREDLRRIAFALQSALGELRSIAAGLRLPALEELPLAEVAARAVQDFQRKAGAHVALESSDGQVDAPLSVKITLYRLFQEALTNAYRHGGGVGVAARVWPEGQTIWVEVRDAGPGFDPVAPRPGNHHLGLVSLRERIELLGGSFAIESQPGRGTVVRASLPLDAGIEPGE
ncbi:MAG: sensor histidine kinase, partial [Chloroflexi bacterium]|nr:sensor histidine kinase [Chloroflexota bacterium]